MKRLFFLFLLLISGSCTNERSKEGFVSLSPAATEIVYMLGARDSLKGVSDYCDRPPRAKEKPSAGGIINPSIEKIISLSPETVFIMPGLPEQIFRKIEKAGINTIELKSEGIEDIFLAVEKIARLCGKTARGDEIIDELKYKIEKLNQKYASKEKKKVYAEISSNPAMSPGQDSHINEMIQIAGGRNVSGVYERDYILSSVEFILKHNPDVILILYGDGGKRKEMLYRILQDRVSASKKGNIHYVEKKDVVVRPGPGIIDGIKELAGYIHSGQADD